MFLKFAMAGLCLLGVAQAETASTATERFTLQQADGGFLRLDRTSGAMSFCTTDPVLGLVCRLGADERATYEAKVSALTDELARAKAEIAAMQSQAPGLVEGKAAGEPSGIVELLLARMIHAARNVSDGPGKAKPKPDQDSH